MKKSEIEQNLRDAACPDELTAKCMADLSSGRTDHCVSLLRDHRRSLVSAMRKEQRQIDFLDYLLYSLKEEK